MSAFLAGFDVLAAGTILGAILLAGLFIWFALDDHAIEDGLERRRREAAEALRERILERLPEPERQPQPARAEGRPDEVGGGPSPAPLQRPVNWPENPDDPSRPRRAA